jgi:hypothetical protein
MAWTPPTPAEVDSYFDTLNNWNRWGADDQRGTLNLITPDKRRAATHLGQAGALSPGAGYPPRIRISPTICSTLVCGRGVTLPWTILVWCFTALALHTWMPLSRVVSRATVQWTAIYREPESGRSGMGCARSVV